MTTRTTFEDRLLVELRREIDLRADDGTAEAAPTPAGRRRFRARTAFTAPRLGLVALACAAAAGAAVLMPGSPAETPAYAVVSHSDGTVTVTMNEFGLGGTLPDGLVEKLKAHGIHVVVDKLPNGYECTEPRGKGVRSRSDQSPGWVFDLRRGDSLVVEKMGQRQPDGSFLPATGLAFFRGEVAPCDPVPAPPHPAETSVPR
ncbi:hypothetical protein [Streptomyces justiciae]|uniref:hypothetical protein n=1 Tax=Streptomyces justiciae TaxID=2780140 RepID=UPI00187F0B99|nr:hypothetical protein [Streptomyces justiciae]MBE8471094.1 hypothetical protein [Streptomyces justiciae]MCW8376860.1 hypothetical protein [Streptomyces justiciae]